ncbi:MAG: DedA family protein [alpha proteobacterium HIMB59]|nr:MAG: DedA family protein [alpha proteobacterium HIMB59]
MSYFKLFLISFLAATILPFSSELILTTMYLSNLFETYFLLIFASIGNILGSITNWYLGKKITIFQDRKWFPVSPDQLDRSQKYFQKYGLWSLLLAWVPIIGDPLTLLAGVLNVRFSLFLILVSISKISRYLFILYVASLF